MSKGVRKSKYQESELQVIMKARDLMRYIFTITHKSPKHFRPTIINRLQNLSMEIVEGLVLANEVYVTSKNFLKQSEKRSIYQENVKGKLRLLAYFSEIACTIEAIPKKKFEQISLQSTECLKWVNAWRKSDRLRVKEWLEKNQTE